MNKYLTKIAKRRLPNEKDIRSTYGKISNVKQIHDSLSKRHEKKAAAGTDFVKMSTLFEKTALNRLTKEILKAPGKFNLKDLASKGALRSKETFSKGVIKAPSRSLNKYVEKINKQSPFPEKVRINHVTDFPGKMEVFQHGGYGYKVDNGETVLNIHKPKSALGRLLSPAHSVFDSKEKTEGIAGIFSRHEAHEAKAIHTPEIQSIITNKDSGKVLNKHNQVVGNHASLEVLGREANDVRNFTGAKATSKIPYPDVKQHSQKILDSVRNRMEKIRRNSGESKILRRVTGKRYGSDKFTERDLMSLRRNPTNAETTFKDKFGMNIVIRGHKV